MLPVSSNFGSFASPPVVFHVPTSSSSLTPSNPEPAVLPVSTSSSSPAPSDSELVVPGWGPDQDGVGDEAPMPSFNFTDLSRIITANGREQTISIKIRSPEEMNMIQKQVLSRVNDYINKPTIVDDTITVTLRDGVKSSRGVHWLQLQMMKPFLNWDEIDRTLIVEPKNACITLRTNTKLEKDLLHDLLVDHFFRTLRCGDVKFLASHGMNQVQCALDIYSAHYSGEVDFPWFEQQVRGIFAREKDAVERAKDPKAWELIVYASSRV